MFIVLLKFGPNRGQAKDFMSEHRAWLQQGFADKVFLMAGTLQPQAGGVILAHHLSEEELAQRVAQDPFVAQQVVTAEILAVTPSQVSEQLGFLMETPDE